MNSKIKLLLAAAIAWSVPLEAQDAAVVTAGETVGSVSFSSSVINVTIEAARSSGEPAVFAARTASCPSCADSGAGIVNASTRAAASLICFFESIPGPFTSFAIDHNDARCATVSQGKP